MSLKKELHRIFQVPTERRAEIDESIVPLIAKPFRLFQSWAAIEHLMKTRSIIAIGSLFMAVACALAGDIEKGEPTAPPNAKAVAGSYYCGDGLGYNVTLTLKESGSYSAEWHGCLGKYGDASGSWKLSDKRIVFTSKKETGMMKDHLKTLNVLKYKGSWMFVRADDRDVYDKHGVSRYSCFQKREQK